MFRTQDHYVIIGRRFATDDLLEEARLAVDMWRGLGDALTEYGYGAEARAALGTDIEAHRERWQGRQVAEGIKQAMRPEEARALAEANTWAGKGYARLKKVGRADEVVAAELNALARDRQSTEVSAAELKTLADLLEKHKTRIPDLDDGFIAAGRTLAAGLPGATDAKVAARGDVTAEQRALDEHDGRIYTAIVDFYEAARHYARTSHRRDLLPRLSLQVLGRQAAATAGRPDPAPAPTPGPAA